MSPLLLLIFAIVAVIGAIFAGYSRDPYSKLIGIGIIVGGVMPLIIARGYADVAAAIAVIVPLSTIFVLQLCRKGDA